MHTDLFFVRMCFHEEIEQLSDRARRLEGPLLAESGATLDHCKQIHLLITNHFFKSFNNTNEQASMITRFVVALLNLNII